MGGLRWEPLYPGIASCLIPTISISISVLPSVRAMPSVSLSVTDGSISVSVPSAKRVVKVYARRGLVSHPRWQHQKLGSARRRRGFLERSLTVWHHGAGLLTCGDAAGVVDPVTEEGISAALESGRRAGQAMASYLESGRNPNFLEAYSSWVSAHFTAKYRADGMRTLFAGFCGSSEI